MSLVEYLIGNGYRQINLTKSGVGHFHTAGMLNQRPIAILIDTGAASTVFSFDLGKELDLSMLKLPISGGGAGGARLDVYQIQGANFLVGDMSPRVNALLAMNLAHVNEALKLKGQSPVDAILGADALEAHSAIIDYGSHSLFLAPN